MTAQPLHVRRLLACCEISNPFFERQHAHAFDDERRVTMPPATKRVLSHRDTPTSRSYRQTPTMELHRDSNNQA